MPRALHVPLHSSNQPTHNTYQINKHLASLTPQFTTRMAEFNVDSSSGTNQAYSPCLSPIVALPPPTELDLVTFLKSTSAVAAEASEQQLLPYYISDGNKTLQARIGLSREASVTISTVQCTSWGLWVLQICAQLSVPNEALPTQRGEALNSINQAF